MVYGLVQDLYGEGYIFPNVELPNSSMEDRGGLYWMKVQLDELSHGLEDMQGMPYSSGNFC